MEGEAERVAEGADQSKSTEQALAKWKFSEVDKRSGGFRSSYNALKSYSVVYYLSDPIEPKTNYNTIKMQNTKIFYAISCTLMKRACTWLPLSTLSTVPISPTESISTLRQQRTLIPTVTLSRRKTA